MKTYDFSKTGGFPLDQDVLGDMHDAFKGPIDAMAGTGSPDAYIINGLVRSGDEPDYSFTAGYVYYAGEVWYCAGGDVSSEGSTLGLQFQETESNLTYNNGSVWPAITTKVAVGVDTATADGDDGPTILYSALKRARPITEIPEYVSFEDQSTVTHDTTASTTTIVKARKNLLTNVIEVAISVQVLGAVAIDQPTDHTMRAVDTGIDLPWAGSPGCSYDGFPVWYLPVMQNIASGYFGYIIDTDYNPIRYVVAQLYGARLWICVTGTDSVDEYSASGFFVTQDGEFR